MNQPEQKLFVKLEELASKDTNIECLPDFADSKKERLFDHSLWKKLGATILERLAVKNATMACLVKQPREVSVAVMTAFDQKKLVEGIYQVDADELEVVPLEAIVPSRRLREHRLPTEHTREGLLFDSKKAIGLHYRFYRLGKSLLCDIIESSPAILARNLLMEVAKELMKDLFEYHLELRMLNRIDLHHIVLGFDDKFFLVPSEASSLLDMDQSTSQIRTTTRFPGRFVIDKHNEADSTEDGAAPVSHNPMKSDVYNLGRIVEHVTRILQPALLNDMYVEKCLIIKEGGECTQHTLYPIMSMLEAMTDPDEERRFSSIQMMLFINETEWFVQKLRVPYQRFFEQSATKLNAACNNARVQYRQVPVSIEGELRNDLFERSDPIGKEIKGDLKTEFRMGMFHFDGEAIYEGEFSNNQPQGTGRLRITPFLSYQGSIDDLTFHGAGAIYWLQEVVYKGEFYRSIPVSKQKEPLKLKQSMVYTLEKRSEKEHWLRCHPGLDSRDLTIVLNLSAISSPVVINVLLKALELKETTSEIALKEKMLINYYCQDVIDQLVLNEHGQQRYVIVCKEGHGKRLLELMLNEALTSVDVNGCSLTDEEFRSIFLCNASLLNGLEHVNFAGLSLKDNSWISFIGGKKKLSRIDLSNTKIGDHGLTMLLHSQLEKITSLRLNMLRIDNYSIVKRLMASEKCRQLKVLELEGAKIEAAELLKSLQSKEHCVRVLNLSKCLMLTDKAFQELFSVLEWTFLRELYLSHTNISSRAVEVMCSDTVKEPSSVEKLSLAGCLNVKPSALRSVLHSDRFSLLSSLDYSSTSLCDYSVRDLAEDAVLKKLAHLSIASCFSITSAALKLLLTGARIGKLESLDVARLTAKGPALSVLHKHGKILIRSFAYSLLEERELRYLSEFSLLEELRLQCCQLTLSSLPYFDCLSKLQYLRKVALWCDEHLASALVRSFGDRIWFSFRDLQAKSLEKQLVKATVNNSTNELIKLSQSELFQQVRSLNLSKDFSLDERYLSALFSTPNCRNITSIDIGQSCLGSRFLEALLLNRLQPSSQQLARLQHLSLRGIKDNIDDAFCKLAHSGIFSVLQVLDLSWTNVRNTPLEVLASCNNTSLRELDLSNAPYITDTGLQALAASQIFSSLQELDLKHTNVTNRSLQALASSKSMKKLTALCLCSCENISTSGLRKFLTSNNCSLLTQLDVSWLKLDKSIFEMLASHSSMSLRRISLAGLGGCWEGLQSFIESKAFQNVEELDLSFSTVKEKHLTRLLTNRSRLAVVNLDYSTVGDEFRRKLQELLAVSQKRKRTKKLN